MSNSRLNLRSFLFPQSSTVLSKIHSEALLSGPSVYLFDREGQRIELVGRTCDEAFAKLKTEITEAEVLVSLDLKKPFPEPVGDFQTVVGGKLTKLHENCRDGVVAFSSKKLSDAEKQLQCN